LLNISWSFVFSAQSSIALNGVGVISVRC